MPRPRKYPGLTRNDYRRLEYLWRVNVSVNCVGWRDLEDFLRWTNRSGYIGREKLRRLREDEPYSPRNCYWEIAASCYPEGHPCHGCEKVQGCRAACLDRLRYWNESMEAIQRVLAHHLDYDDGGQDEL